MDLQKKLQQLSQKRFKFSFKSTDIDLIYAATNEDSNFVFSHFGREPFEEMLERVNNSINTPSNEGFEVDGTTMMIYQILLKSLLDPEFKEQLIKETSPETFEAARLQVREYLEKFMKE